MVHNLRSIIMSNTQRNLSYLFFSSMSVLLIGAALTAMPARASERIAAPLNGATHWINSPPLSMESLRGKVVLIDFWTYGCFNCMNALPHVKALEAKYRDQGLVVIGVHTPEFAYEKVSSNVEGAVRKLEITYPVAMDNDYQIWNAYRNQYWPAQYLVDAQGQIRYQHFGEGAYQEMDQMVQNLLNEAKSEIGAKKRSL
jgi:thiol-disulfide isomerase/thioredoxin